MSRSMALCALVLMGLTAFSAATEYTLTRFDVLPGTFTTTNSVAVSNAGAMVVSMEGTGGVSWSFFIQNGVVTDISDAPTGKFHVTDINSAGDVVGYAGPNGSRTAYLWNGGAFTALPGTDAAAMAISDSGYIAGITGASQYIGTAAMWAPDRTLTTFGTGNTYGVNELGTVVGFSLSEEGETRASYWDGSGVHLVPQSDLKYGSRAYGINDDGAVVGTGNLDPRQDGRGLYYRAGTTTFVGPHTMAGEHFTLWKVNNAGLAVGTHSYINDGVYSFGVLYNGSTLVSDINSLVGEPISGYSLVTAQDINEGGAIVGFGQLEGSVGYSPYILTPVPEPATVLACLCGLAGICARRKRRV